MATKNKINQRFYEKHYKEEYAFSEKLKQADYLLTRLSGIYFKPNLKVLDVGCGIGVIGSEIKKRFKSNTYGIDISRVGITSARKRGVKTKIADIEKKWPYNSEFFSIIIGVQVLEHVISPDYFLQEAKRVLSQKGIIILTTPNLANWLNRIIFFFGYQPFFSEVSTLDKTIGLKFTRKFTSKRDPLGHIRVFTLKALVDILELHGFEILEKKGGRVGYFPGFLKFFDFVFSFVPSLATDLIIVARKRS